MSRNAIWTLVGVLLVVFVIVAIFQSLPEGTDKVTETTTTEEKKEKEEEKPLTLTQISEKLQRGVLNDQIETVLKDKDSAPHKAIVEISAAGDNALRNELSPRIDTVSNELKTLATRVDAIEERGHVNSELATQANQKVNNLMSRRGNVIELDVLKQQLDTGAEVFNSAGKLIESYQSLNEKLSNNKKEKDEKEKREKDSNSRLWVPDPMVPPCDPPMLGPMPIPMPMPPMPVTYTGYTKGKWAGDATGTHSREIGWQTKKGTTVRISDPHPQVTTYLVGHKPIKLGGNQNPIAFGKHW